MKEKKILYNFGLNFEFYWCNLHHIKDECDTGIQTLKIKVFYDVSVWVWTMEIKILRNEYIFRMENIFTLLLTILQNNSVL